MDDGDWAVLLGNDEEDFFDDVVVDLASRHPFIQCDAPGVRPVHHLAKLAMTNLASGEVNKDTATKSVKYWAGTWE